MNQDSTQVPAAQRVWSLAGTTAIYIEKQEIYRIVVSDLREHQNGFSATATPLRTHGLPYRDPWEFDAAWAYLSASDERFAFTYGGWELFLEPSVAEEILAIVAELPVGMTYEDDYIIKPRVGNPKFVSSLPGPVATRVNEFLQSLWYRRLGKGTKGSSRDD